MIELAQIAAALDRLTGDAVKLAVHLAVEPTARADQAWARRTSRKIGVPAHVVLKIVKELAAEGLVLHKQRTILAPMSPPDHSLARAGSRETVNTKPPSAERDDEPPWIRKRVASEASEKGEVAVEQSAGGRNGDLRPRGDSAPTDATRALGDHARVVDAIDRMYAEAYKGARPTWGPKNGRLVKLLLKAHDADEVIRRARVMFFGRRSWPRPPYDVSTLSAHFDKFGAELARGGMVGDERRTGAGYYGEVSDG